MSTDRRGFLAGIAAASLSLPLIAEDRIRVVGYLLEGEGRPRRLAASLAELGYVEGKNLRFEIRGYPKDPRPEQIDQAARALASSGAEVLVSAGALAVTALHRATTKIPIVSGGVSNPVTLGLAKSLREPGGNVTGLSFGLEEVAVLQLGTLRAFRPGLKRVTFVISLNDPADITPEHAKAAAGYGLTLDVVRIKDIDAADRVFRGMRERTDAAWIAPLPDALGTKQVAASAIRHRIATHGLHPTAVREGLLVCHGLATEDPQARVAVFVDKILRGANPATIPFELPDRTLFVINRATAAAIGVEIPEDLKLRATEIVG